MSGRLLRLLGAGALLVILAGCSKQPAQTAVDLKVTATTGFAFDQGTLAVRAGQPVKLTFVNQDSQLHDWSIEKIAVAGMEEMGATHDDHGGGMEPMLHVAADSGATASLEFTPTEKGTFQYYCTVPGHRAGGMEGTLVVE